MTIPAETRGPHDTKVGRVDLVDLIELRVYGGPTPYRPLALLGVGRRTEVDGRALLDAACDYLGGTLPDDDLRCALRGITDKSYPLLFVHPAQGSRLAVTFGYSPFGSCRSIEIAGVLMNAEVVRRGAYVARVAIVGPDLARYLR
jgi:hypothetical protein